MDRLACVSLPELPLQVLLARHPEWAGLPAAVAREDKPTGEILWTSPEARRTGVLPGMRYTQGLSIASGLRAAEVPPAEVRAEVDALADLLRRFTPEVEISSEEPGVFWLNAVGLARLHPSASAWAKKIHEALAGCGRRAAVAVGFRRFAVYAVARSMEGVRVFARPEEEGAALGRVPLARLAIDPGLRDTLAKLGIRTVGEFLKLPALGVRRRFGAEAERLHALAAGQMHDPLVPAPPFEPVAEVIFMEEPEGNALPLLFLIRRHLHPLLRRLAHRGEALRELEIGFVLEREEPRADRLRPAEPTLDETLVLDLVRLRLEAAPLPAPAAEINLTAHGAPADKKQLALFFEAPRRDLAAAERALARLRAELGEGAVVRARLIAGHLPEARFAWEPLEHLTLPRPRAEAPPVLVRRFHARPVPLASGSGHEPDGWIVRTLRCGTVIRVWGPYMISGGWWRGTETHRRYYYLETGHGDLLWVYYDGPRRRWFLHGQVE